MAVLKRRMWESRRIWIGVLHNTMVSNPVEQKPLMDGNGSAYAMLWGFQIIVQHSSLNGDGNRFRGVSPVRLCNADSRHFKCFSGLIVLPRRPSLIANTLRPWRLLWKIVPSHSNPKNLRPILLVINIPSPEAICR